jgi:peptidoglycan-N-acetylglucosamine deacetylase
MRRTKTEAILAVIVTLTLALTAFEFGAHRVVAIRPPPVHTTGKVVYLSFDDGPTPGYTNQVLADLNAAGAHATFFEIGSHMIGNKALIAQLIKAGNVIGDHSQTHPSFWALTPAQAYAQVNGPVVWMRQNLGYKITMFRYPYGISSRAGDTALWALGLRPEWWNIETPDWNPAVPGSTIINQVMASVRPGYVIGLHDGAVGETSIRHGHPDYLPRLLTQLKAAGYSFGVLNPGQSHSGTVTGGE